jgi:hypothetical protein
LQPTISINYGKDFRRDYLEVVAKGPPGSYVFTSVIDYEVYNHGDINFLTEQKVSID